VHQGDAKGCADMLKVVRSIGAAIIHIELSGKSPFEHGLFEGIQKSLQSFRQIKPRIGHKPAVVIDEGDQIRLFLPGFGRHHRTVHHIALPQIIGQFGFKFTPVLAARHCLH